MKQILLVFFCAFCLKTAFSQQKNPSTDAYEYYIEINGFQNKQHAKSFIAGIAAQNNVKGFFGFSMPSRNFLLQSKTPMTLAKFKIWVADRSLQITTFQPGIFSSTFIENKKKERNSNKSDRKQKFNTHN